MLLDSGSTSPSSDANMAHQDLTIQAYERRCVHGTSLPKALLQTDFIDDFVKQEAIHSEVS